jgi:Flp pilus assembly protein TadD
MGARSRSSSETDRFAAAFRLHQAGDLTAAEPLYRESLAADPNHAQCLYFLGLIEHETGRDAEALATLSRAIAVTPHIAVFHVGLGNVLVALERLAEAAASFQAAIALNPELADAHNLLGTVFWRLRQADQAAACFRRVLHLRPDYPEAHNNLGIALMEQGRLEQAEASFRRGIALRPTDATAINNLGTLLVERQCLEQAIACYRHAIELVPGYAAAHVNLAMASLAKGDMALGWRLFERRWEIPPLISGRRTFAQPQWQGEARPGETLLIHVEQGFGDTIQFCRYATLAAERGLRVILQVQKPLVRLLRSLPGAALVIGDGDPLPHFDVHCPTMSLPLACGTTVATIPARPRYLHADPAASRHWADRLADGPPGPRIGLVWAGMARPGAPLMEAVNRRRSMAPERLAPLLAIPGLHFVSLQKDRPKSDLPLTDFMDEMTDFADTAALIDNLDLVISVDSAVLHLAGALGKPVWMLNRYDSCWRWLTGRRDSPWYPTLRIYRQPEPNNWDKVIAHVAYDLKEKSKDVLF